VTHFASPGVPLDAPECDRHRGRQTHGRTTLQDHRNRRFYRFVVVVIIINIISSSKNYYYYWLSVVKHYSWDSRLSGYCQYND